MERLIFAADDGSLGRELYVSDGGTPSLLGDLFPGPNDGAVFFDDFAVLNGLMIVTATDGSFGREPYVTDGTFEGTFRLKDVFLGPNDSDPNQYEASGGLVFFNATTSNEGRELWVTDGTDAGTTLVKDIRAGGNSSNPSTLFAFNDGVLFSADDGVSGTELYFSDGTFFGTQRVKDIFPNAGSSGPVLTENGAFGDVYYFSANDGTNGNELWVTDGTGEGTRLVSNIRPGGNDSNPSNFAGLGERMYFTANDGTNGTELWVTDGTEGGTTLLKDIRFNGSSSPQFPVVLGDRIVFSADDGTFGRELWVSDGTPGGTILLRDINGGGGSSFPLEGNNGDGFAILGDKLIFTALENSTGSELYITDGTVQGTSLLLDIEPGANSSSPDDFVTVGDKVFFTAFTSAFGRELWMTDGTAFGTMRVSDIDPGTDSSSPNLIGVLGAPNIAPTDLALSSNVVQENTATGTFVGTFSATDADGDPLSFSLKNDGGGLFAVSGSNLVTAGAIDFEATPTVQITAQADDGNGGTVSESFTITVTDVNENPGGTITGTSGNDLFSNTPGADTVLGGAGTDTIVYNSPRVDLLEELLPNGQVRVTDTLSGTTDILDDVEILRMTDGDYRYDLFDDVTVNVTPFSAQENLEYVYRLYAASLGRTPGADGLEGWFLRLMDGRQTQNSLADAFVLSAEFQNKFAGLTDAEDIVTQYFVTILKRDPAPAGLNFWVNKFNTGSDLSDLLTSFAKSPEFVNNNADNYDDGVFVTRGTTVLSDPLEGFALNQSAEPDAFLDLG